MSPAPRAVICGDTVAMIFTAFMATASSPTSIGLGVGICLPPAGPWIHRVGFMVRVGRTMLDYVFSRWSCGSSQDGLSRGRVPESVRAAVPLIGFIVLTTALSYPSGSASRALMSA